MYAKILKGAPIGNCNAIGGKVGECGKGAPETPVARDMKKALGEFFAATEQEGSVYTAPSKDVQASLIKHFASGKTASMYKLMDDFGVSAGVAKRVLEEAKKVRGMHANSTTAGRAEQVDRYLRQTFIPPRAKKMEFAQILKDSAASSKAWDTRGRNDSADKKFKKGNKGVSDRNTKSISGKAYIASLEKDGWKVDRVSGSHHIMTKPGYRSFPVPNHNKDLGIGLLRALNKLAQTRL